MKNKFVIFLIIILFSATILTGLGNANVNISIQKNTGLKNNFQTEFNYDITITLTPYNPPIKIPSNGGNFSYTIEVKNNEDSSLTFDVWTMYSLPNGSSYGPVFGPEEFTLPAGWSANKDLTQYVSEEMPAGNYTYIAYAGLYPNDSWDNDNFDFKKLLEGSGWYHQSPGTDYTIRAIDFVDTEIGWASGSAWEILHTTNGGDTWYPQDYQQPYPHSFNDVDFIDNQTGWVVGSKILHTEDGGENWEEQQSYYEYTLNGVFFIDENKGWAVGGYVDFYGSNHRRVIEYTNNGGENWYGQLVDYYEKPFSSVHFVDENNGWAVGGSGAILHTNDGGDNWEEQTSGTSSGLSSVFFINQNKGWCVGDDALLYTYDGGDNWNMQTSGTNASLESVCFVDENTGWIVGVDYYPYYTTILHTIDGGDTWELQNIGSEPEFHLYDIYFIDENNGWAAGSTFYPFEGVMLHTENGGGSPMYPELAYYPSLYDFGDMYKGDNDTTNITIWNNGSGILAYYLSEGCTWISVTPEGGFSTGEKDNLIIEIDTRGMKVGSYQYDITILTNDGEGIFTVYVNIIPSFPELSFYPSSYDFGEVGQYQLVTTNLTIWNSGNGTLYYHLSEGCDWVVADPWSGSSKGEKDNITIMAFTSPLEPGSYECDVTIYTNDGTGIFTVYITVIGGETNEPPEIPEISGPTNIKTDKSYDYSFQTKDPDENDVYFYIDWGDGNIEEWIGPCSSGEPEVLSHTWTQEGTYTIKAKAKDINDAESDWKEFDIIIEEVRISSNNIYLLFNKITHFFPIIKNIISHIILNNS